MTNDLEVTSNQSPEVSERTIPKNLSSSYTLNVAILGIMTALETVSTAVLSIYIPSTNGYFNLGDGVIFITAILFGAYIGGFVGGVGSSLADIILGYASFAPITLIVKGLEGFVVGLIYHRMARNPNTLKNIGFKLLSTTIGSVIMVSGYFLAEYFILGLGSAAIFEVPANLIQVLAGIVVAIPITASLEQFSQIRNLTQILASTKKVN